MVLGVRHRYIVPSALDGAVNTTKTTCVLLVCWQGVADPFHFQQLLGSLSDEPALKAARYFLLFGVAGVVRRTYCI